MMFTYELIELFVKGHLWVTTIRKLIVTFFRLKCKLSYFVEMTLDFPPCLRTVHDTCPILGDL